MLGRHVQGVADVGSLRDDIEHLYVREGVREGGKVYVSTMKNGLRGEGRVGVVRERELRWGRKAERNGDNI
jgi:hypothetical protein